MADNTLAGIIGIVAIVFIAAIFFWNNAGDATITGNVAAEPAAQQSACNPGNYCVGSKAMIIREDCSFAQAYCDNGCVAETGMCA